MVLEGGAPQGHVVLDSQGDIFGTVAQGGDFDSGSLFKIDTGGNFKIIHAFDISDGTSPQGGLVIEPKGDLFGVTQYGGERGAGVIYKLIPKGKFSLLYSFGIEKQGAFPAPCMVSDHMGHLFGTATEGAKYGAGAAYRAQE